MAEIGSILRLLPGLRRCCELHHKRSGDLPALRAMKAALLILAAAYALGVSMGWLAHRQATRGEHARMVAAEDAISKLRTLFQPNNP